MSLFSPVPPVFTLFVWGLAGFFVSGVAAMSPLPVLLGLVLAFYLVLRRQEVARGIGAFAIGAGAGLLLLGGVTSGDYSLLLLRSALFLIVSGGGLLLLRRLSRRA